jgi:TonB family protein
MKKPALAVALLLVAWLASSSAYPQTVPTDPTADRIRGMALYQNKAYRQAAAVLKKVVKSNRGDADAWYYLGLSLIQDPDELNDASKAFEAAVKLLPSFVPARAALAYSLLLRNRLENAARHARAALEADPNNNEAHYVLGVVLLRSGAKEEALQHAEASIKLQPQAAAPYLLKSQALVRFLSGALISEVDTPIEDRKSRYREAAAALERYLELNPKDPNNQTWTSQLESLRFYMRPSDSEERKTIFSGKNLDSKARVLSKPEPQYTERARGKGVVGTVILRCVFGADGTVKYLLVIQGLPYGLTEATLAAAKQIKFVPAMKDGRPASMYIQLEYNFNLF